MLLGIDILGGYMINKKISALLVMLLTVSFLFAGCGIKITKRYVMNGDGKKDKIIGSVHTNDYEDFEYDEEEDLEYDEEDEEENLEFDEEDEEYGEDEEDYADDVDEDDVTDGGEDESYAEEDDDESTDKSLAEVIYNNKGKSNQIGESDLLKNKDKYLKEGKKILERTYRKSDYTITVRLLCDMKKDREGNATSQVNKVLNYEIYSKGKFDLSFAGTILIDFFGGPDINIDGGGRLFKLSEKNDKVVVRKLADGVMPDLDKNGNQFIKVSLPLNIQSKSIGRYNIDDRVFITGRTFFLK